MKNWKTTLVGAITGFPLLADALIQAYTDGQFTEKKGFQLAIAIAIIILGWILKDPKKPDVNSLVGTRPNDR